MPASGTNPGYGIKPLKSQSEEDQIAFATDYLTTMQKRYNGDMDLALMSYNWGPGNVDKWIKSGKDINKVPEETRNYVLKITGKNIS